MTAAWIALEDSPPGAGRFYVYPGSHRRVRALALLGDGTCHPNVLPLRAIPDARASAVSSKDEWYGGALSEGPEPAAQSPDVVHRVALPRRIPGAEESGSETRDEVMAQQRLRRADGHQRSTDSNRDDPSDDVSARSGRIFLNTL